MTQIVFGLCMSLMLGQMELVATVHVSEGAQLIAPATPGEVAINPITIEEEVAEEEVQEEVCTRDNGKKRHWKSHRHRLLLLAPPPVTFPRPLLEQTPPPNPSYC